MHFSETLCVDLRHSTSKTINKYFWVHLYFSVVVLLNIVSIFSFSIPTCRYHDFFTFESHLSSFTVFQRSFSSHVFPRIQIYTQYIYYYIYIFIIFILYIYLLYFPIYFSLEIHIIGRSTSVSQAGRKRRERGPATPKLHQVEGGVSFFFFSIFSGFYQPCIFKKGKRKVLFDYAWELWQLATLGHHILTIFLGVSGCFGLSAKTDGRFRLRYLFRCTCPAMLLSSNWPAS